MPQATIVFKSKPVIVDDNGKDREVVFLKKVVTRSNCNLKNHEHPYYNSDLFPIMLQRAYENACKNRSWFFVDELPENITIHGSFLKTVTVNIDSFLKK